MAAAGASASREAERQRALAEAHEREATLARAAAARFGLAGVTEKRVATSLSRLTAIGYHLLPDRGWPGSRNAQVDLVVVGPSGVWIVDTKAWKEVTIAGGRIFRGDADVTEDLSHLASLAHGVQAVLVDVGLAPIQVRAVAVLAGHRGVSETVGPVAVVGEGDVLRHIAAPGARLTSVDVDNVLRRVLDEFPVLGTTTAMDVSVPEPVLAAPVEALPDELPLPEEVEAVLLESMLAEPIETWMSMLDADQAKLVRRSFNGPSRIRGSAGTGKTVVGLHRAAHLARDSGHRVLFTTFVRTLPQVLQNLLHQFAPEVTHLVDFHGVHSFARGLLAERGCAVRLDPDAAELAFGEAWLHRERGGALDSSGIAPGYWKDEIAHVIKGRGITSFETYARLARVGRRHRLTVDQRKDVWSLYERYDRSLRRRGIHDHADVILLAVASLKREPLERYQSVIVDEAQDLTCAMVELLHLLVGDGQDGFTLIGDGQQTIYPGGYTLAELGISLSGRGVVLGVNHRNTAEILAFANDVVAGDEYNDIEGSSQRRDDVGTVSRTGPAPTLSLHSSWSAHDEALVERIRDVTRGVGTSYGDVAVLAAQLKQVDAAARALRAAGIPVIALKDYDGRTVDAVKVGTVKRAKGLEFKQVLLTRVAPELLSAGPAPTSESDRERRDLDRRELYVAMTRARDGLWVGSRRVLAHRQAQETPRSPDTRAWHDDANSNESALDRSVAAAFRTDTTRRRT